MPTNIENYREMRERGCETDQELVFDGAQGSVKKTWIVDKNRNRVPHTIVYIPYTEETKGAEYKTLGDARDALLKMISEPKVIRVNGRSILSPAKEKIPWKWPGGYCFICCRPIPPKRKLCDKHINNKRYQE